MTSVTQQSRPGDVGSLGILFDKDVPIRASDGLVLRANLFRPSMAGQYPVIMALGPYGKDVHFRDAYPLQWDRLKVVYPGIDSDGSSGRFLRFEVTDPERWVPFGYVVIHVDSRGAGKSPGLLDPRSARETRDFYDAIEWAAIQPWSNGKVGLLGVSFYAINQWHVAALQPPHLAAIAPWEGAVDAYRDVRYHGGIFSNNFLKRWWHRAVLVNQHGNAESPHRDSDSGERTTGAALSAEELESNRVSPLDSVPGHPLDDVWFQNQTPDLQRIKVPLLSAGNWGGLGLHLRGNIEGYLGAASAQKWLEIHTGTHFDSFYLPSGVALQRRFFDHFLKSEPNDWGQQPSVQLAIRDPRGFRARAEKAWPISHAVQRIYYLDAPSRGLRHSKPASQDHISYDAMGDGVTFTTPRFTADTEFTGPVTARLWVSSSTTDLDLFATVRCFDPSGAEVTFVGANEPAVPVTQGWLRASHRKIDQSCKSLRHTHDEVQKLRPGEPYQLDVEIWPTSIVIPAGYALALTLAGKDFERRETQGLFKGSGPFLHNDPENRDPKEFGGSNTVYTGGERASYLAMPEVCQGDN